MATHRVIDGTCGTINWLSVANPANADSGAGVFDFTLAKTTTIAKMIQVPEKSAFSLASLGIKHGASADWDYQIALWETDDLHAAGATRDQIVAGSAGLLVPLMRISRDAAEMGLPMPEFRTKRKYILVEIVATTTPPGGNVTFSPLFYYADDERT